MSSAIKTRRSFAPWKNRSLVFVLVGLLLFWIVFVVGAMVSLEWALGPYDDLTGL